MNEMTRKVFPVVLVFGGMVFGMILAGSIDLTPTTSAAPAPEGNGGVRVDAAATAITVPSFADLAAAVSPAVASIQVTTIEPASERRRDALEFFFGPRGRSPRGEGEGEEERRDSSGSGFVISGDGQVVTNYHVIEDATSLTVHLGGRQYEAEVIGQDPATDIALLQIEPERELTYLNLGDSDSLRPGDWVMVIGSPLQLQNSVSVGVVSAKARRINITQDSSLESFIQTDAAINFGNSGGPLVDVHGSVVGIATAINFGAENIGFAVPVAILEGVLGQLREHGSVRRGYLGVNIANLSWDEAEAFGLESNEGALVTEVLPDSPAEKVGVHHGDIILRVDDHHVEATRDLIDYVALQQPGTTVEVELFRDGERMTKKLELDARPDQSEQVAMVVEPEESAIDWLGIQYQNLTPGLRSSHGMPDDQEGVMVTSIAPSSALWEEGVREGHVIAEVNRSSIADAEEFEAAIEEVPSGGFLRFYVTQFNPRGGQPLRFFAIVRVP